MHRVQMTLSNAVVQKVCAACCRQQETTGLADHSLRGPLPEPSLASLISLIAVAALQVGHGAETLPGHI